MTGTRRSRESGTLAAWLMLLVIADLLFLPRLLFAFGIPISLLIVVVSLARNHFNALTAICILGLVTAMLASVVVGSAGGNPTPADSLKRALQLASILFYALYRVDLAAIRLRLVKVLRAFYIYVSCAALLFLIGPEIYESLLTRIYPEAIGALPDNLQFFRFPYIFEDPNSAAYLIAMTLVAYLSLESDMRWVVVGVTLASAAILATQSRGAYIALLLIFGHRMWVSYRPRRTKLAMLVILALTAAALTALFVEEISHAYVIFDSRFEHEDDVGGGRAGKYAYFIQNINLLPFGTGYHLMRDGVEFRPHSDVIRLNLAYGVLALPMLLYFIVPRRKSQVLLFLVVLIPMLINTVIDDYRLLPVYLLLFSLLRQIDQPSRQPHPASMWRWRAPRLVIGESAR